MKKGLEEFTRFTRFSHLRMCWLFYLICGYVRALKRWFFVFRDEMELEVVRWMSLHMLKQKQRYKHLVIKQFLSLIYKINVLNPRHQSRRYTIHICLPSSFLPTKVYALNVTCNQLTLRALILTAITHLHKNRVWPLKTKINTHLKGIGNANSNRSSILDSVMRFILNVHAYPHWYVVI